MDQVIFNGSSKIMKCLEHVDEIDVQELYMQWKNWVFESDNSKYLQAFHVVGGEPTISDQTVPPCFFLINGWTIEPKNADHDLFVKGLLFSDNGRNPISRAAGYTVAIYMMTPSIIASNLQYAEIQRQALEDMMEQFMQTVLQYNDFQKQLVRDAMTLNPSPGSFQQLHSIDTIMNRIDLNTQNFGTTIGEITLDVDTTLLENKISLLSNKVEDVRSLSEASQDITINIGNKVDLLVHRVDGNIVRTDSIQYTAEEIQQLIVQINNKLDSIT